MDHLNFKVNKKHLNNSKIEKNESNFKETIFGVFYILLKDENSSLVTYIILLLIEFFQIMRYPFKTEVIKI